MGWTLEDETLVEAPRFRDEVTPLDKAEGQATSVNTYVMAQSITTFALLDTEDRAKNAQTLGGDIDKRRYYYMNAQRLSVKLTLLPPGLSVENNRALQLRNLSKRIWGPSAV